MKLFFKSKQKEFEDRMFPVAQREQELAKKEAEIAALHADTEARHKGLMQRIESQELWFQTRENTVRDAENKVRDQVLRAERRQQELTQQYNDTQERLKLLKVEQTDIESRDRDVKWKEQQLQLHQTELREKERKLHERMLELNSVSDKNDLVTSELNLKIAMLEVSKQEVANKQNRLLIAQTDYEEKLADLESKWKICEATNLRAQEKERLISEQLESVTAKEREFDEKLYEINNRWETLLAREAEVVRSTAALESGEKELLEWMVELMSQQQLVQTTNGKPMSPSPGPQLITQKFDLPKLEPADLSSATVVRMQLRRIQEYYIGSTIKKELKQVKSSEKANKNVNLLDLKDWDVVGQCMENEARDKILEEEVQQLLTMFHSYIHKFPSLTCKDITPPAPFTESDRKVILDCTLVEQTSSGEYDFILELLNWPLSNRLNTTSELQLVNSIVSWYKRIRKLAHDREMELLRTRKAALEKAVTALATRESQHPAMFPHKLSPLWEKASMLVQSQRRTVAASVLQRLMRRGPSHDKIAAIAAQRVLALEAREAEKLNNKVKKKNPLEGDPVPEHIRKHYSLTPPSTTLPPISPEKST
eukprot:PhF_6_TR11661/c3_g1_i1/m.18827